MKRILVAILVLCVTVTISLISMNSLNVQLDTLEEKTILVMKNQTDSMDIYKYWKESETLFAFILNEEKYKVLSKNIYLAAYRSEDELLKICEEILFEINIIRETQQFSFENIL